MSRKPCGRPIGTDTCTYERMSGKQRCVWHWLMAQPITVQAGYAQGRLAKAAEPHRARVPAAEWPDGERWCAGCQSFVPLFYCRGSRCKACASAASHAGHVEKTYGITAEEYDAMLKLQGGVCFICGRKPHKRRLAVDHDHHTNEVRGLLCSDNERGCNHAVLGTLETSVDGILAAAKRVVEYLEDPPYRRLGREVAQEPPAPPRSARESLFGVPLGPPPF